jgi:N-acetyl-gamma-glutamylphosphate reductase
MRPRRSYLATAALVLVFSASACAGAGPQSATDHSSQHIHSQNLSPLSANDFEHAYEIKDFYRETKPAKRTL